MPEAEGTTPPVGEEIHLPGPSILPLLVALGLTFTVIGTTISLVFIVLGIVIFLVSAALWIRDARHEYQELPPEHHS
jgi:hypothetical protein